MSVPQLLIRALAPVVLVALQSGRAANAQDVTQEAVTSSSFPAFTSGVDAYRRGRYEEAAARFEALLGAVESKSDRAQLAYDLGCASYRLGRPLEAVGWNTIALDLDPHLVDARHNLERARAEAGLEPANRGDLQSTLRTSLQRWTPSEARRLLLFGLVLFGLALLGEALRGGRRWRRTAWVALGLLVLSSLPRMALERRSLAGRVLGVRAPEVALRSEPRQELEPIASLAAGSIATRVDELPDWVRVQLSDGTRGWVPAAAVMRLDPFEESVGSPPD